MTVTRQVAPDMKYLVSILASSSGSICVWFVDKDFNSAALTFTLFSTLFLKIYKSMGLITFDTLKVHKATLTAIM